MTKFKVGDKIEVFQSSDCNFMTECGTILSVEEGSVYRGGVKITYNSPEHFEKNYCYGCDFRLLEPLKIKKTIMQKLSSTLKRILSSSMQSQYKSGIRDGALALTNEGKTELLELLAVKFEKELTERADEIIVEEEKELKNESVLD